MRWLKTAVGILLALASFISLVYGCAVKSRKYLEPRNSREEFLSARQKLIYRFRFWRVKRRNAKNSIFCVFFTLSNIFYQNYVFFSGRDFEIMTRMVNEAMDRARGQVEDLQERQFLSSSLSFFFN
jgi:hypothetical protein